MGAVEERLTRRRGSPVMRLVQASSIEREADEIARRILEQAASHRPFRDMGIITRNPKLYEPVLRATLERFGIPARFYFDSELNGHAIIRFLTGVVDALLAGWDYADTLAVLRLAPDVGIGPAMDRIDFAVRMQLPGRGLEFLKAAAATDPALSSLVNAFSELEPWTSRELSPRLWADCAKALCSLVRFRRPDRRLTRSAGEIGRSQSAALNAFGVALDEAVQCFDSEDAIPLSGFWPKVKSVLRLSPLRVHDLRREVVHVIGAHEARQWALPVVFVCGLVEKQFPSLHRPDPFFPDFARCRLRDAGIRVRTAAEFEAEERFLFDAAVTRASILSVLSYPQFDAQGEQNLRSVYLDDLLLPADSPVAVRPQPRRPGAGSQPTVRIGSGDLLERIAAKTATLSPTALETYLQCPFRFFGRHTLALEPAPPRPHERLDARVLGSIIHRVLAEWNRNPQAIEPLFERLFQEACDEQRIPPGYAIEAARFRLLEDLQAFVRHQGWPAGFRLRTELEFAFPLRESLAIRGRIDRLDSTPDGRGFVIDYKYSSPQLLRSRLENVTLLQAQLYLIAVERCFGLRPAGVFYCGLRGQVRYAGWCEPGAEIPGDPIPASWLRDAEERAWQAATEIRSGRIHPEPADLAPCAYCDFRDVCRYQIAARASSTENG